VATLILKVGLCTSRLHSLLFKFCVPPSNADFVRQYTRQMTPQHDNTDIYNVTSHSWPFK